MHFLTYISPAVLGFFWKSRRRVLLRQGSHTDLCPFAVPLAGFDPGIQGNFLFFIKDPALQDSV